MSGHVEDASNTCKSAPVEVVEERNEIESELEEDLVLLFAHRAEDFGSIVHVRLLENPGNRISAIMTTLRKRMPVLVDVDSNQRYIEEEG